MAEKIGLEAVMDMADFSKGVKQYTSGIDDMTNKTEKGSSIFGKIGGALGTVAKVGIAAAIAGFGALTAVIADSVREAMAAQEVEAQLDAVLKATGGAAGMTKDEILGLADALSQVTPYEDDMIAATETVLLQFRNIGKDVFPQATEMALDLATRLGIDVTSAAKLLGKALEEPGEGLTRLRQAGVSFSEEQQKMIEAMVASGNMAGAQKLIMDELGQSIGGAARAAGETFTGKMTILQNSIGNVKESIGTAFLPVLTQLADKFSSFVQENGPALQAFFQGIADWTTTKLIPALLELWNWLQANLPTAIQYLSGLWTTSLQPALAAIWSFLQESVLPLFAELYGWLLTNLPGAIQTFTQFWTETLAPALAVVWAWLKDSLIPTFMDIYNWLATNIPTAIQTLSDFWTTVLQPALAAVWSFIESNIIPIFQKMASWFSGEGTSSAMGWVDTIRNFLGPVIQFMSEQFSFIVNWVKENWPLIQKTIETVMEAVKKVIETVLTVVKKIVETALTAIKKFWEDHGEAIKKVASSVWEIIKTVIDTTIKTIAGIIKAIMQAITGDWEGAWDTIRGIGERVMTAIQTIIYNGFEILKTIWNDALTALKSAWGGAGDWMVGVGRSIVEGLKAGFESVWNGVMNWVRERIRELEDLVRRMLNIKSPSGVFAEIGKNTMLGFAKGIEGGIKFPVTAVLEGVQDIKSAASQQLGAGMMMGYNRQSLTPAYATAQNVNVSFGDTTINSGLDAELFQAQVLQTVTRAVRGY